MVGDHKLSESDGGSLYLPNTPLWEWLSGQAHENKSNEALVSLHQPSDHLSPLLKDRKSSTSTQHFAWTYGDLLEAVENLAAIWYSKGVKPGDSVFTFVDNSAEWAVFLWASVRLGLTFVPLDPSVLRRDDEIRALISTFSPVVILVGSEADVRFYDRFGGQEKLKIISSFSRDLDAWIPCSELAAQSLAAAPRPFAQPDRTALVMLTSGTSNRPKICPVSEKGMMAQISQYHLFQNSFWDAESRMLVNTKCYRPICWLGSLCAWQRGGTVVLASVFDPGVCLDALVSQRCTHTWFVPAHLRMIAGVVGEFKRRPTTLKLVLVSGDTASGDTLAKAERALQPRRLVFHWGMSEGAPLFGFEDADSEPDWGEGRRALGFPLQGTRVRICAHGATSPVPRGESGELHVSSLSTIQRYLGETGNHAFYKDDSGRWFITGDVACMDDSGIISVTGRTKDIIKCSGAVLVPSILEDFLNASFDLTSYVVGIDDDILGAVPVAVVNELPDLGTDAKQQMKDRVKLHLGAEYVLGDVFELSALNYSLWPRDSSDKVQRSKLRERVLEVMGRTG